MRNDTTTGYERPTVVFDVLGTLVDQFGSLKRQVSSVGSVGHGTAANAVNAWLAYVATQEKAITAGQRGFAPSHVLDREAVGHLVDAGVLPWESTEVLSRASEHMSPWPDTLVGLHDVSQVATVLGLSNASRRVLAALSSNTGMRWHQVVSAEDANAYKPQADLYRSAVAASPETAEPPIMVAAHAWDLRAAATVGMRTAYVPRPNGDEPVDDDEFDFVALSLKDLNQRLQEVSQ